LRVQEFINEFRKQDQIKERENRQTLYSSNRGIYSWRGIPIIGYRKRRRRL